MNERFFPFNPRSTRYGLLGGAAACIVLAGLALYGNFVRDEPWAWARGLASFALMVAFAIGAWRIRPRETWGVWVTHQGLRISPPLKKQTPIEVAWSQIRSAELVKAKREALKLTLHPEGELHVGRQMFATDADFKTLVELASEKVFSRYDA